MRTESEIDVLVLGGAGVDTIVYVPELPLPFADSHLVPAIETRAGQTGDFLAVAAHALGLRTHHLDLLGDDHEGDLVRALHRDRGVPLTEGPLPGGTRRAVNLVGPDGRRCSLYDGSRSQQVDELPPDAVRALARVSRHVHVSISQPCAASLPLLHELGVPVSTDLHDWDGSDPYHEEYAHAADLVFLSAARLTDPERTMRRITERGRARTVVATDGARGAYHLVDGALSHVPPVTPPSPVVDSNGAGDAFAAGYLFGRLTGEPPHRCALYGAIAGAHACTVPSTRTDSVSRAELLARAGEPAR
ncbi:MULTISPECIES: adenosine kinase [Streptomyces]|uniref:Putative PfkB family carbohydrate kinase n=2 Tax=Streptomyces scabiei TaxID=1930 RepID=C9YUQ5_STRSW|nr:MULTISPECIES: adenosine kinase [Streptomyces]MBP5860413.1 adenosine kinase [Streptomyces sp. LBUM 1484]MBP5870615.1 adenosine kinase [Streptomyces sp. LBUM 1485]MBP5927896.1 adenosine kinase [Streptomyces sp. LBUM 1479]KFG09005.1 sugar kinase [Streptomyces scabiei]MBP5879222.1 adenosine kinase [Streptomyces sp. LBUM 1477]